MNDLIELLPLPEKSEIDRHLPTGVRVYGYTTSDMKTYARACVAHATAAKDAEIEALRAEVERLTGCLATANANHEQFERQWYLERDRAERLEEALRPLAALDLTADGFDQRPDSKPIYARNNTVITVGDVRKARAALHHTATQENDDA